MPIGLGIGLNISMRGGLGSGFSLTAPVLAFASATDPDSDNTQDLTADFYEDIEGYVVRLVGTFGSATVSEPYDVDSSNTIDAGESAALEAAFTTGAIDDGVCSFKCRIEDGSGNALSDWSNTVTKTVDATAPTITSSNAINQAENAAFSHTLTANESVTWTKTGGADTALFTLTGSGLTMTAKDYETPEDADTNNTYVVQVTATDTAGNATNQTITVTVTNVAEGYSAVAVNFDGTNDYIKRGAALTGAAASKVGTVSVWFRILGADAVFLTFCEPDSSTSKHLNVYRDSGNKINVIGCNTSNTQILNMKSTGTYVNGMGWAHLLASWDLAAGTAQMYINDVDVRAAAPTITDDNLAWNGSTEFTIGARSNGTIKMNGDISEFYINSVAHIDLSVEANRRKFISAGLKPVDLGADGSTPTGTAPIVYLKNSLATWETNVGSGGGFTETGALTSASSSPSD